MDKTSLLKELEYYSRILEKHTALKKQKELKSTITSEGKVGQQASKPKSFQGYEVMKNQFSSATCLNQKYSFKKISGIGSTDKKKNNRPHNQRQNFNSKYSLSKNKVLNKESSVNKFVANCNNVSIGNSMSTLNSKRETIKVPCISSNGSGLLTYSTKDFIKEVESLTELLKKKASSSPRKILNSALKCDKVPQNKLLIPKKNHDSAFDSTKLIKRQTEFSQTKGLAKVQPRIHANKIYANSENGFINLNKQNLLQPKVSLNKSVYKKDNVKKPLNINTVASLRNIKSVDEPKNRFQKITSKPTSRKVIFSNSIKLSHDLCTPSRARVLQMKTSASSPQEFIMKLCTPNRIISSSKKLLRKSPRINKIKSPVFVKTKSPHAVKAPKIVKLKQTNTRFRKINKLMTPPNKRTQLEHPAQPKCSLKKMKKKVNSKYKIINKTLIPNLNRNTTNALCTSVNKKNTSVIMDSDTYLEALNDSAVEKLEQNLLAISSELTTPLTSEKNKICNKKVNKPFIPKVNAKIDYKRTPFKKSKSRISKYKIINSNVSQKFSVKDLQSPHITKIPLREKVVLVQRLFKSKNVIINKNASPTSYRAKMIKSKYLSFNKRKSSNNQKYIYPAVSQHMKFKATRLPLKQRRFRTNAVSTYHPRLIRKTNYGCHTYKPIYKNRHSQMKDRMKKRYSHSSVVFIQGTRYTTNINGKTLRKLPVRGHTVKTPQRSYAKLVMRTRTPETYKTFPASINLASRVLHRSINRILTASSKKKLSKVNTYCMFYNRFGRCNRGVKCTYIHDPSKIAVCSRFLRGICKINSCPFSHEVDPGKMAICSFFLVGQCEKEHCPYRHEKLSQNAVLCKDFVQGYCCYGKECKKAHILICPKYMQGECDRGSLCAFPHPPQKAKKNVLKEVEDEGTKPTEVLLEKVLRYFQQGGDSKIELDENSSINLFVPKQRKKLEEQPSFIPLSESPAILHNSK